MATAGVAAADVTITGGAEMGIAGGTGADATFFQSVDVRFTLSGESDNGLSFGAVVDLDDVGERGTAGTVDVNGAFADFTVFVDGAFGRLEMGDTDGAFDWAMDDVNTANNAGSIGDNETGHAGYFGNAFDGGPNTRGFGGAAYNGQVLRYNYSIAGFGVAVSAQVDGDQGRNGSPQTQIGLTYDVELAGADLQFGLGYVNLSDANRTILDANASTATTPATPIAGNQGYSATGVSVLASLDSGFAFAVNYTDIDDRGYFLGDGTHIGVGVGYTFDAITVSANWGEFDWATTAGLADSEGFGISASYDFGAGLTAHVGYGESTVTAVNAQTTAAGAPAQDAAALGTTSTWSLGLSMSF